MTAQAGLKIFLEQISQRCGTHGRQSVYRHRRQPGHGVVAVRKVSIPKVNPFSREAGDKFKTMANQLASDADAGKVFL